MQRKKKLSLPYRQKKSEKSDKVNLQNSSGAIAKQQLHCVGGGLAVGRCNAGYIPLGCSADKTFSHGLRINISWFEVYFSWFEVYFSHNEM